MDQPESLMNLTFDDGECCICYTTPQVVKASLACGHVFCRSCIMRWSEKRNICPACVQEFDRFVFKNANGKTEVVQIASEPKVDQEPHQRRLPKLISATNIFSMLSVIPLLMLVEDKLKFLDESNRNFIIIVIAVVIVLCGVRVGHHNVHQLHRRYFLWYEPLHPPAVNAITSSMFLLLHFTQPLDDYPLLFQWLDAFLDVLYEDE